MQCCCGRKEQVVLVGLLAQRTTWKEGMEAQMERLAAGALGHTKSRFSLFAIEGEAVVNLSR
jgi:hypothetical protein